MGDKKMDEKKDTHQIEKPDEKINTHPDGKGSRAKRSFRIEDLEKITGIKKKIIKQWEGVGHLKIGMPINGRPKGERIYTIDDLYKIVLFARMISVGAKKVEAASAIKDPATWRQHIIKLISPFVETKINMIALMVWIHRRVEYLNKN